jgi:hypothetical protein
MYEDDTIRLFGVANILKNKKDKNDNWERDDMPDIKHQELTGKYDHNFDAPGSDFQRAHQYNFNNIEQPENTKTDVNYDKDKYTRFLNYTPSKYIQLEEDEYKPIGKYNEKADEYYIDNLQGKTLDDMVIGKMKENAGANDLPRDAARRQFVDDMLYVEEDIGGGEMVTKLFNGKPKTKGEIRQLGIMQEHEQNLENERLKRKEKTKISIERPLFKKLGENIAKQGNQRRKEFYDNVVADAHYDEKQEEKAPYKKAEGFEALFKNAARKRSQKDVFGLLDTQQEKKQLQEGMDKLQSNVRNQKVQRAKAHDEKEKIDAFNLNKNKKQLSQGLQALSNNAKRVKFQKAPENKKTIELAQKNKKIQPLQFTHNSPSQKPLKPPEITYKRGGKAKAVVEVLPAPQPSPTKSVKTDVASYMGSSSKSDLDEIKVKKGYHPSTQAALENHQQQKLEAGLPKYAISLEVVNQNYDGAKAGTLISDVVKKEVNSRTGKTFFPIREKITVEQATKKLKDEINRRTFTKGATLTADALSQHNQGVGSPLLNKTSRGASKELSFT